MNKLRSVTHVSEEQSLSVSHPLFLCFSLSLSRSRLLLQSTNSMLGCDSTIVSLMYRGGKMADHLPSGLLEACVVVGASGDKLKDVYQVIPISKCIF